MNTTIQWEDLWTNGLKRWEQSESLRKEREMMMESKFAVKKVHNQRSL